MDKGKETPYHMQRYCSSILRIGNHKIVIIDSNLNNFEVLNGAEIIILGAGFKGDINDLTKYMDDSVMVIHSSIRRKKENEYISILKEKGKAHHSLRNDGPYKSYLSKKSLSQ